LKILPKISNSAKNVPQRKKIFGWGLQIFVSGIISGELLGHLSHFIWPWAQTVRW